MLKQYVFKCFLRNLTSEEYLMLAGRVFHSMTAVVFINRLPSFTVLLLFGSNSCICRS